MSWNSMSEAKKVILMVEDEPIIAMDHKISLERYGYAVKTVYTGEEALETVQNNKNIDLILMDIDLGDGIDGAEAALLILKERDIPILFHSSHTETEVVEKTEKITSYGYVVKNSGITILDASIKMAFKLFEAKKLLAKNEITVKKKLQAILEPEGDIGALQLFDIIDHEALQSMMEDFYRIINIGIAVGDVEGNDLVAVGWPDICSKFHRICPATLSNCHESDVILTDNVQTGTYKTYKCKNNLWDMVTPIEVGGRHLGNFCLGQFFYDDETPDLEVFRNQARLYGFNEQEYLEAVAKVPRCKRDAVEGAMAFCAKLALMISSLGYSKIKLSRALYQKDIAMQLLTENNKAFEQALRKKEEERKREEV